MEKIKNVLVCDGIKAELFEDNGKYQLVYRLNGKKKVFESANMHDIETVINTLKRMKPQTSKTAESITSQTDNIILTGEFGDDRLDKVKNNFGDLLNLFSIQQRTNELINLFPEVDKYELKKIAEKVIQEGITDYKQFAARKLMIDAENKTLNAAKKKRPNKNDFINKGLSSSFSKDEINVGSNSDYKLLSSSITNKENEPKRPEDDMPILCEAVTDNPDYENLCDILERETENLVVVAYQEEDMMEIAVIVTNDGKEIKLIKAIIEKNKLGTYDVTFRLKDSEEIENPDDEDEVYAQEDKMIISAECYMDALLSEKESLNSGKLTESLVEKTPDNQIVINAPKMGEDLLSLGQTKLSSIFEGINEGIASPKNTLQQDVVLNGQAFLAECEYTVGKDTYLVVTLNNEVPLYITKDKNACKAAYRELLKVFNS